MTEKSKPEDLTPEERLFKIIQDSEQAEKGSDTVLAYSGKGDVEGLAASQGAEETLTQTFAAPRGKTAFRYSFKPYLSLRTGNWILAACLVLVIGATVVDQFFLRKAPGAKFLPAAQKTAAPAIDLPGDLFTAEELDQNMEIISKRNLFQPPRPVSAAQAKGSAGPVVTGAPSGMLSSMAANLKLTGIYQADYAEALIEAVDEKKTYSVKAGDPFRGVKIKEVKADGVILTDGVSEYFLQ